MKRPRSGAKKTQNKPDWRHDDPNHELEKSRYADPIASRELILKHLAEAPEPLTAARLAKRLGLNGRAEQDALAKRLAAMVRDGQAFEGPNGFATAGEGERVAGRSAAATTVKCRFCRMMPPRPWCWHARIRRR